MDITQLNLLVKQSKFNKDCNTIIDLIAPIICNKKITKREIDKAQDAITKHFGIFNTWTNYKNEVIQVPLYTISKYNDYGTKISIYAQDRHIPDRSGTGVVYISDYQRIIYTDRETGELTQKVLEQYKYEPKYIPTRKQIESAYNKFMKIEDKIKKLEDQKRGLPFHYYFNK